MYINTPFISSPNYCPNCGTKNNSYNYCPNCGRNHSNYNNPFKPIYSGLGQTVPLSKMNTACEQSAVKCTSSIQDQICSNPS